ncbi:MAG: glycosyltransferase [Planctomycetaceae bacterium]|nr:glycosyltransferase [Planctomycetaceae bacterium]
MNNTLVSIIIPCFNAAEYVGEAIESALNQTAPHIEVIVIDDGSTDDSVNVLRSYEDRICWQTGPNRGGGAARNTGLKQANGEFVQFLDADDLLHLEKVSRQLAVAARHPDRIVYSDYDWHPMGEPENRKTFAVDCGDRDSIVFILEEPRFSIQAPLHRRNSLLSIGGFREDLKGSQEIDLHLRLACAGHQFTHLPERLSTVRGIPGSVSSHYVRTIGEQLKYLPDLADQLEQIGQLTDDRRSAFAGQMARLGRACLQRGGTEVGMAFLAQADRLLPSAGINMAYSPKMRPCVRLLGPTLTERLVLLKRRLCGQTIPS